MPLIIKGRVIPLTASDPDRTCAGRVFLNDAGTIEDVTDTHGTAPSAFARAAVVDVGDALVVPGLIDLHPGGFISAAERLLQLFTPDPVVQKFAFRATPLTLALATARMNQEEFGAWSESIATSISTGEGDRKH